MNSTYIRLNETLYQERLEAAAQARRWRANGQPAEGAIERLWNALSAAVSGLRPAAQPTTTARNLAR